MFVTVIIASALPNEKSYKDKSVNVQYKSVKV